MLKNRREKIPCVQVKQKNAKIKNLIKKTPSKLHYMQQHSGQLRTP